MTPSLKIHSFAKTDCGLLRDNNEDAYWLSDVYQMYAVADGLGGLPQGELASHLAVQTLEAHIQKAYKTTSKHTIPIQPSLLTRLDWPKIVSALNEAVYQKGLALGVPIGIGTTLTLVHIVERTLHLAHMGDSGVYILRDKRLEKLTKDHTLAQNILDSLGPEEPIPDIPEYFYHTLTRCLGHPGAVQVDELSLVLQGGERILLYTDGVTKVFSDEDLAQLMRYAESPKSLVEGILSEANHRGGPDNSTAIALFIEAS